MSLLPCCSPHYFTCLQALTFIFLSASERQLISATPREISCYHQTFYFFLFLLFLFIFLHPMEYSQSSLQALVWKFSTKNISIHFVGIGRGRRVNPPIFFLSLRFSQEISCANKAKIMENCSRDKKKKEISNMNAKRKAASVSFFVLDGLFEEKNIYFGVYYGMGALL